MASILSEFDQEEYEEMIRRESKEDGFQEGLSQGIEQGIEKGICIFINDKLEDGVPQERIIEKLMKNYNLDRQKAQEYIKQCEEEIK